MRRNIGFRKNISFFLSMASKIGEVCSIYLKNSLILFLYVIIIALIIFNIMSGRGRRRRYNEEGAEGELEESTQRKVKFV